jgi:predicted acyltransferase
MRTPVTSTPSLANASSSAPRGRLEAIDQFRGFAILLMVLADYLARPQAVPAWLKHAHDVGFTVIDLIAPLFIFAIGLTYGISFRRRLARSGVWQTAVDFVRRYAALIGIGFILTMLGDLTGVYESTVNWGLLQAIGAAGLLTLLVIWLRWPWRLLAGLALLAAYQLLLDRFWLQDVLDALHGGPWAAIAWGGMLILATVLADFYHDPVRRRSLYPGASLLLLSAGIAMAFLVPVSKNRVSASYVLITVGASALIFGLFHLLDSRWQLRLPVLSEWGKNALLLYLLHGVLIGVFVLPPLPGWYTQAPLWLVTLQAAALVAALSWIGIFCNRRGWFLNL